MTGMSSRPGTHDVPISSLRMDGGTQARVAVDEQAVAEYADAYRAGEAMPPVECYRDEKGVRWLADGFHRVQGAHMAGLKTIGACTYRGTREDAIEHAARANAGHGLRRTNADKRRAVEMLLALPKFAAATDRAVAAAARVDHKTVAAVRAGMGNSPPAKVSIAEARGKERVSITGGRTDPMTVVRETQGTTASAVRTAGGEVGLPGGNVLGDEGAGAPGHLLGAHRTPAPGEPPVGNSPPIDMLGMAAPESWFGGVGSTLAFVKGIEQGLKELQARARYVPQPHQQRLYAALHEAAALARALRPDVACPMCKDPDGQAGRRKECLCCAGLGWLTVEGRKGLHPSVFGKAG